MLFLFFFFYKTKEARLILQSRIICIFWLIFRKARPSFFSVTFGDISVVLPLQKLHALVPTMKTLGSWRYILVHTDCENVKDTSAWALLLKKKLIT